MVWFSFELKSGERMLMICRENEAKPDESPAKVFINTKKLGDRGREGEWVRMGKWRGWAETEEKLKIT